MSADANILVVDDEIGPRESLKLILKPYYNVYTADRGAQAIEMLDQIPVDLVTVDLKMPGMPGITVLESIKKRNPDIEAIVITGYGSMDTAIEGLRLGAFDYIAKPFDVTHILNLVRRALERRNTRLKLKELKSEFLANITHEMRTPLSVVIGFVYLLLDQLVGTLTPEQQKVLERVYKNSEDLLDVIDNALFLTSLRAGEVSLAEEELDLDAVLGDSIKQYEKILNAKGIEVSIDMEEGGLRVVSDPAKLARIFQNLLHNAAKFTLQGRITVKARRLAQSKRILVEITDTGVGIPPDHVESIFKPFRQVDGSSRRPFPGLGLGLTVADRLTKFLGGNLEIRSEPDRGTQVMVSIPFREKGCDGPPYPAPFKVERFGEYPESQKINPERR
ncbi:MAG: response regulator [Deltaproteobacteria bacterium]|nr:response regulator [Deltaproteobacteria bacterium]